jgi:RHS repeat-associated protein
MANNDELRGPRQGSGSLASRQEWGNAHGSGSTSARATAETGATNIGLPSLSAPTGGGSVRTIGEKFATNAATGTASLSIPISTSPSRGGFALGLGVHYDSGAGNGPFGVGWQLSVPSIARKTDKGLPRYLDGAESDVFLLSGAEDLVPVHGEEDEDGRVKQRVPGEFRVQRYRPRVEGAFARIERWTHRRTGDVHWRTTSGGNVTSFFGRSPEARVGDPEDPKRVFSWLLEETRDDRGNVVRYTYKGEDGAGVDRGAASESNRFVDRTLRATSQRYLKRIEYGNHRPGDTSRWLFEVVFDYGEHDEAAPTPDESHAWPARSDPFSTYRAGFEVRTYRLCRRVLMFHRFDELGPAPVLVRSTDFTYEHRAHLTKLTTVTHAGYLRRAGTGTYERATLPPLELGYVERRIHDEVKPLEPGALDGIRGGVDGAASRWVDLDSEGIAGVLVAEDRGWYYKANLGGGHLAPPALLRSLPVPDALASGVQQLTDLAGEGRLDLVQYLPPVAGYFERTEGGSWMPFIPFRSLPQIHWDDPNLRFLDVDGDGIADVLITRDDAIVWYRSRGKEGFDPPEILSKPRNEERGPAVVFADRTEAILLADMSGDGLVDIVRVRNGEVCYWPNLGYGRFGRKVVLDGSPWFDPPDQFDPGRVRLADLDGSGTADIIYLGHDGVRLYFNESGNCLSEPVTLGLPLPHAAATVSVIDLLGTGTACLVWSSRLAADGERPLCYVDLMGGQKPHLLARFANGSGGETRLAYAASTSFYLKDKAEGHPWITRLSFPVHLVERVEHYDHVAETKLVTRYRYHHGYYDPKEREYRGFAYVEQWDAETIGGGVGKGLFADVLGEVHGDLILPPVRTRRWFHTGAWLERERLEHALARDYYQGDPEAPRLMQPRLPPRLSVAEEREAARALRGHTLRQEVYAEDDTPESIHPYSVSESTYEVRLLQREAPRVRGEGHAHAVFFTHALEALTLHYERRPHDPRVEHTLVLEVDDFGNILESAAVAYPRRNPIHPEQGRLWATLVEATFANHAAAEGWYRVGIPVSSTTSELTGLPHGGLFTPDALRTLIAKAVEIPFEEAPGGTIERRPISRTRWLYYRDELSGPLALGHVQSLALPYQTLKQAFTPGLVTQVYGDTVDDALLISEAHYVKEDGGWWASSGRLVFSPEEFYQPVAAIDPFGERYHVRYDAAALVAVETEDPLGNTVRAENDYRVLAPKLVTDANRNRTAVAFDTLGMPIRIARLGKEGGGEGDTLDDPTIRVEYDLLRYLRTQGAQPAFVHTLRRERHGEENRRWQESYSYHDGSGREAMRKVQAAPGEVPARAADGRLLHESNGAIRTRFERRRWIGSGRTVFDNKRNPVKKYEPFFSDTFDYESERELVEWGVTPILRYDPLGRLLRTDLPDGTLHRIVFDAWCHQTWDENDTVLESRWYRERGAPDARGPEPHGDPRRRAAWLAAQHADTPERAHVDPLGRTFLTEADNKDPRGLYRTRLELDVLGNTLAIIDARGNRTVDRRTFDLLHRLLFTASADAGWSRMLPDVASKTVRGWDARGQRLRYGYDALRRPTDVFFGAEHAAEELVGRHVYGEGHPEALARNLRTRVYQTYDGAGVATNARFDFEGNLLVATRRLARAYRETPTWSRLADLGDIASIEGAVAPLLDPETFVTSTTYDALGRVVSRVTPDRSETRPSYNEASLLDRVDVRVRDEAAWTAFVEGIEYNARGQRVRIARGNGSSTSYAYDAETFRLTHLVTGRPGGRPLQDLVHTYDPVGNVVQVADRVSFGNPEVPADGLYVYDPLYRLTSAEGREHPGQQPSFADAESVDLAHPHDLKALRRYREAYTYDPVGNILEMAHRPLHTAAAGWVRRYDHAAESNRLLRTSGPADGPGSLSERYAHDPAGNTTAMPHLAAMRWDYADNLAHVDREGGGHVYFAYDAAGERVRKVYEHSGFVEERVYLRGYEVYRRRRASEAQPVFERESLHVLDGEHRLALVETKTVDRDQPISALTAIVRYQLGNHLDSAVLELDDAGRVISYEEYLPFGVTALRAARTITGLDARRYRYTGRERDEETGLYYNSARYYAAWLGRWMSPDPAGMTDGTNLYHYASNRPTVLIDPAGTAPQKPEKFKKGIGGFNATELNEAAATVFGEISATFDPKVTPREAHAVASEIFNRQKLIKAAHAKHAAAKAALGDAKAKETAAADKETKAAKAFQDLSGQPTKRMAALRKAHPKLSSKEVKGLYDKEVAHAETAYKTALGAHKTATAKVGAAQTALVTATSELVRVDAWLRLKTNPDAVSSPTLTQIVAPNLEFQGHATGLGYLADFSKQNAPTQASLLDRWKAAKKAVEDLAHDPSTADVFTNNMSTQGGKRQQEAWEVRIGGNDFSTRNMHR